MNQRKAPKNIAASVRQRLLNLAHNEQENYLDVLRRYALERTMYRVSRTKQANQLILKGAMVFCLWQEKPHRATRDLDYLGSGESDAEYFRGFFRDLCHLEVEEDGLHLVEESIVARQMREDEEYRGVRIEMIARLENARIPLVIDIGFGDVVTPPPAEVEFPSLLDFPRPHIRAYHRETVIAEKFWIMSQLGMNNTRLKDYYDLWTLARRFSFEGEAVCQAIRATFARRDTPLLTATPVALTAAFSDSPLKQSQWTSFLKKGRLVKENIKLVDVLPVLCDFLLPPAQALLAGQPFSQFWPAGGPWQSQDRNTLPTS